MLPQLSSTVTEDEPGTSIRSCTTCSRTEFTESDARQNYGGFMDTPERQVTNAPTNWQAKPPAEKSGQLSPPSPI